MQIEIRNDGTSTIIAPEGRIDTVTAPELEDAMTKLPEGTSSIVFDFAKVEYISSAGLRILLVAQKTMKNSGGSMSISSVPPAVKEVFDITGFSDILTII